MSNWFKYVYKKLLLLLIICGLSVSNKVFAQAQLGQSTASIRNVVITAGASTSSASTNTYNAIPSTGGAGIGGGIFAGTDFGTLDLGSASLLLQGGTVQISEAAGETYDNVFIRFGIKQGTAAPALTGNIPLTQTGYDAGTMTRTFSVTNAAQNILALATTGGSGTNYRFDITVNANGTDANGDDVYLNGTQQRRSAKFNATGTQPVQPAIVGNTVAIGPNGGSANSANGGADVTYNVNPSNPRPFQGANLSSSANNGTTYDVNNGQLLFNGGSATTTESSPFVVNSVLMYYRVRSVSSVSAYQSVQLTQTSNNNGAKTFVLTTAQLNLIASSVVTSGTDANGNPTVYNLDVYYQANITNTSTNAITSITDPSNPNSPYSATFSVTGTPIAQTIWTGGVNDNWFDKGNWSNGVPNRNVNALIRDLGAGSAVPYPNIYSDAVSTTASGTILYDNTGSGPAETLDLTMAGNSAASRSIARLSVGRLRVFGNFNNAYDSFVQRENTVIEFAGSNQTISGGTFVAIEISGGGIKLNTGLSTVSQSIKFISGLLTTDISTPTSSLITLASGNPSNNFIGAQLLNETNTSYLRGLVRISVINIPNGQSASYGNIGMTLTFNGSNAPGSVEVTRNTVEVYNPLPDAYSARRIFNVRPADQATSNGGLDATLVFGYQNIDTRQLAAGSAVGTITIPEQNLILFNSQNSGNSFDFIGRDAIDTVNNTVTKYNVHSFATFALGDKDYPLPVTLVAFGVTRNGANAQLAWTTASEENNSGFNVQVSTDGTTFRTLAFVASQSPNSNNTLNYKYTDTENGKTGTRYYRLEQVDENGKSSFSPVRALNFSGAATGTGALVAYPNPFNEAVSLSVDGTTVADGTAYVKVVDMTGRTVRDEKVALVGASLVLNDLSGLHSGLYLAKVTLPDGTTQTVRISKQ